MCRDLLGPATRSIAIIHGLLWVGLGLSQPVLYQNDKTYLKTFSNVNLNKIVKI